MNDLRVVFMGTPIFAVPVLEGLLENYNVVLVIYDDSESDYEINFLDVMGNITEKYKAQPEKKLKFTILNYRLNEPRDILNKDNVLPKAFLYTNAMKEQKLIRFKPKNETEINIEEFENFLSEKLNWNNDEVKEEKKDAKEEKIKEEIKTETTKEEKQEDL